MQGCKVFLRYLSSLLFACGSIAFAQTSIDELNKETQNPVANLISVPFQNNFNFNVGKNNSLQYILNLEPVIPFSLDENWNLITRTILPITNQPYINSIAGSAFGLGDTTFTTFLSPAKVSRFIWGVGPAFLFPTATNSSLGNEKWGIGPSVVGLTQQGPWTVGLLANQIWSVAGNHTRPPYSQAFLQPFLAHTFAHGWSTTLESESTYNWRASGNQRWLIPLELIVSKIILVNGKIPVSVGGGLLYYPEKPSNLATWGARLNISLLLPK